MFPLVYVYFLGTMGGRMGVDAIFFVAVAALFSFFPNKLRMGVARIPLPFFFSSTTNGAETDGAGSVTISL